MSLLLVGSVVGPSEEVGSSAVLVGLSLEVVGLGLDELLVAVGFGGGGRVSVIRVVGTAVGGGRSGSVFVGLTGGKLTKSPLAVGSNREAVINVCVGTMAPS